MPPFIQFPDQCIAFLIETLIETNGPIAMTYEATEARIALALEDYRAGRYTVYENADAYLAEVDKMVDE